MEFSGSTIGSSGSIIGSKGGSGTSSFLPPQDINLSNVPSEPFPLRSSRRFLHSLTTSRGCPPVRSMMAPINLELIIHRSRAFRRTRLSASFCTSSLEKLSRYSISYASTTSSSSDFICEGVAVTITRALSLCNKGVILVRSSLRGVEEG